MTLIAETQRRELDVGRLIFLSSNTAKDMRWCELAQELLYQSSWRAAAMEPRYAENPLQVAAVVSQELEVAHFNAASLIADLTLGPKDRSAAIYVASSALQAVTILYAERYANGFRHREVPPMSDFNTWLGRHGVLIRDYKEELAGLSMVASHGHRTLNDRELAQAVADALMSSNDPAQAIPGPRANLLTLMEAVNDSVWLEVLGRPRPSRTSAQDDVLRDTRHDEWHRSAGRAAQALWILRALFAHGQPVGLQPGHPDVIAALDLLSFLSSRLRNPSEKEVTKTGNGVSSIIVAVDGDDVGRRFEERLAQCSDANKVDELVEWSHCIQADLALQMLILQDRWDAIFLARTGDGFLARLSAANLSGLRRQFRPTLLDASATVGIGPTVKDAYLALKLGKARNRGGGLFYSIKSGEETVLWAGPPEERLLGDVPLPFVSES